MVRCEERATRTRIHRDRRQDLARAIPTHGQLRDHKTDDALATFQRGYENAVPLDGIFCEGPDFEITAPFCS